MAKTLSSNIVRNLTPKECLSWAVPTTCNHATEVRNVYDYMADSMAELPSYQQSCALKTFLVDYHSKLDHSSATSTVECVEGLGIVMYEYGLRS